MKKLIVLIIVLVIAKWWFKDPVVHVEDYNQSYSYVVRYSGEAEKDQKLPMLIALHGAGDKPKGFYKYALDEFDIPARIILIQGPISYRRGYAWPWRREQFESYGDSFNAAVENLVLDYPTTGKPVLLGFSSGATMSFYQSLTHGNTYSYIFPISGRLNNGFLADDSIRIGADVIAFHGVNDTVNELGQGKTAMRILESHGVDIDFYEFQGGHHGIFKEMKTEITEAVEESLRN